jgi:thiol-disulfide isomerase/thioredoxin
MVSLLVQPVVTDLIALTVLGVAAALLTRRPEALDDEGTRWDRTIAAGAPWWLGYAFFVVVVRTLFVIAQHPLGSALDAWLGDVFAYVPAYRNMTQLTRWAPGPWYVALSAVGLSGILVGLWGRHALARLVLMRRMLWGAVLVLMICSAPAAWRAHHSWRPAVSGDNLLGQLRTTPISGGGTWSPEGLRGRITLVEFWTTWCGACKRLLPSLRALAKSQTDPRFELLLVNVEGRGAKSSNLLEKIKSYSHHRAPELTVLVDRGSWAAAVGITVYPTLALIGPSGRLLRLWSGTPQEGALAEAVRSALLDESRL